MVFEEFTQKQEAVNGQERLTIEKLNSLDVAGEYLPGPEGRLTYKFLNVQKTDSSSSFVLETTGPKVVFCCFHFDDGKFKHPETKQEISIEELLAYFSEKFSDFDRLVCSCCNPDGAREIFNQISNPPIILGSGSSEYKTVHNSRENFILISPS